MTMRFVNIGDSVLITSAMGYEVKGRVWSVHDILDKVYFNVSPAQSMVPWLILKSDLWFENAIWNCHYEDVLKQVKS